jgi:hypothetical protein
MPLNTLLWNILNLCSYLAWETKFCTLMKQLLKQVVLYQWMYFIVTKKWGHFYWAWHRICHTRCSLKLVIFWRTKITGSTMHDRMSWHITSEWHIIWFSNYWQMIQQILFYCYLVEGLCTNYGSVTLQLVQKICDHSTYIFVWCSRSFQYFISDLS